jgi:hypothetical protein
VGDFNGAGTADLAESSFYNRSVSIFLGNGDGTFQLRTVYPLDPRAAGVAVADFYGDGNLDLAVANSYNGFSIFRGNGDGTFQPAVDYQGPYDSPMNLAVGDFDQDGTPDLAVSFEGGAVGIFLNNGDGTLRLGGIYGVNGFAGGIAAGDLTGNGILDLAVASYSYDGGVGILLGNGDGAFQPPVYYSNGGYSVSVALGDFNGDGALDVVTTNQDTNSVSVLLNNGDGTFQPAVNYPVGNYPRSVAVADLTGDGNLDLVTANFGETYDAGDISVLLGQGDGTFQDALTYPVDWNPRSVAAADFNGDNYPDLAVANEGSSTVSVLINQGDWDTPPRSRTTAKGSPAVHAELLFPPTNDANIVTLQPTPSSDSHALVISTAAATEMTASGTIGGPIMPLFVSRVSFRLLPHPPAEDLVFGALDPATPLE